jgi:hypothetical protein
MISSPIAVDCSAEVKDFGRLALLYEMLPVRPSRRENVPMHSRWCLRFSSQFCEIVFFSREAAFVSRETACFSVGASREHSGIPCARFRPASDRCEKLSAVANTWAEFLLVFRRLPQGTAFLHSFRTAYLYFLIAGNCRIRESCRH